MYLFKINLIQFLLISRTYTDPYCATGMTMAFWVRVLRGYTNIDQVIGIMVQGTGGHQGLDIIAHRSEFTISLDLPSHHWYCRFENVPMEFYQNWMFVSYSYDPSTQKVVCFLNERRVEVGTTSLSSPNSPYPIGLFGSVETMMLDDIFYIPKFSTDEMISTFYNTSK